MIDQELIDFFKNQIESKSFRSGVSVEDSYEEIKRFSNVISLEEIRENDHNLNIRRYADTSPPPENFDVKGILNGCIPIKEIEDGLAYDMLKVQYQSDG